MTTFCTSRQLAVSPSVVFGAIENAQRLARWWGPDGFSNRFDIFEFRRGGKWVFTMIGPDGSTYPNESIFSHIETDRQVVINHICAPHFQLSITLTPTADGTFLLWEQTFDDASIAKTISHIVIPANEQNLNRLSLELGLE